MFSRVAVIMFNTYREAVRARVLHGLFAVALVTAMYCVVVGQFALRSTPRVLSNLGSASVALYGAVVAIILSASALHRELEQKTLFPILARPLARGEYLVGKYFGTLLTLAVFILGNCGVYLFAVAANTSRSVELVFSVAAGLVVAAVVVAWRVPAVRTFTPAAASLVAVACGWWLCSGAEDERRVLLMGSTLTVLEVSVVAAIALVFSAFSSPFLTAIFTLGVFLVGRSADSLAHLPPKVFGPVLHDAGVAIARVVPNLMVYVPERALLTGATAELTASEYLLSAAVQAFGWCALLLAVAVAVFRRRDLV